MWFLLPQPSTQVKEEAGRLWRPQREERRNRALPLKLFERRKWEKTSKHAAECNLFSGIIYCYVCAGVLFDVCSFVWMLSISPFMFSRLPLYLLRRCCRSDQTLFISLWKRDRTQSQIKNLTLELVWLIIVFLVRASGKVLLGVARRNIR